MRQSCLMILFGLALMPVSCAQDPDKSPIEDTATQPGIQIQVIEDPMNYNKLNDFEEYVILKKGTERPWTGKYVEHDEKGVYVCKRCNAPLYRSEDKFDSHCGDRKSVV